MLTKGLPQPIGTGNFWVSRNPASFAPSCCNFPLMNSFRVLQFNMQFGQGWRELEPDTAPVNIDATIAEIRKQNADIVMLQEVEHAQPGGYQVQPPPNYTRLKAGLPQYQSIFGYPKVDPRELPFGIGLAIFSKTALTSTTRLDLPSPAIPFSLCRQKDDPD